MVARNYEAPTMNLDRRVTARIRLEHVLYAILLLVALGMRLVSLADRPLHHDESIHAYYAWRIVTKGPGDYRYDPVYHGPSLYYGTAVFHALLGSSDFSARAFPVLCSVGLVALAWPLRRLIGRREALAYAVLVTFSPTLGYYGRSLRHDVPMAFFTFAGVIAFLAHLDRGRRSSLYLAGLCAGLAAATKEDVYLTAFVFANALWIVGLWTGAREVVFAERARRWWADVAAFLRERAVPLSTAIIVAVVVAEILYTSLLTRPEEWNPVVRALRYWWSQHQIERIGGHWWYYVPLEVLYEGLIFLPALATLFLWLRRAPVDRTKGFFGTWAVLTFAIYAWAQEKVPWLLVPSLLPQAVLAAHFFASRRVRGLLVWAPVAALTVWSLVASNYLYEAPRPEEPPDASHSEPLVYVQTTYDVPRILGEIHEVTQLLGTGRQTPMVVTGDATWPLSWYLRRHPVHWGSLPAETTAPILVVDPKDASRLEKDLGEHYRSRRFAVRGWWQIDWERASLSTFTRFLLFRTAWNPPGTTDAVLFVARDLSPDRARAAHALTPAPPVRRYGTPAIPVEPTRAIGGSGSAPGRLNEPRGLALDGEGNLLVADSGNHRVQRFDPSGRVVAAWGGPAPGDAPGQFRSPMGVAVAPDGSVYVADTWNHRIQKFGRDGEFVGEWREENPSLWGPRALVVAADGTVFVSDTGNKRILAYSPEGALRFSFGGEGSGEGRMIEPVGLAIDPVERRLYVADTGNRRVQVFDLEGRFQREFAVYGWEEFYTEPHLALHEGTLVATDSFNHRINFYEPSGRLRRSVGGRDAGWNRPTGVAVSPAGEMFVSDLLHHRIAVLPEGAAHDAE